VLKIDGSEPDGGYFGGRVGKKLLDSFVGLFFFVGVAGGQNEKEY
jgi:hypothetical protein